MNLLSFSLAYAVIAITPGPNLAVVMQATFAGGRRQGLAAGMGVALGAALLTGAAVGTALLLPMERVPLENLGPLYGAFLIWLGLRGLRRAAHPVPAEPPATGFWRAVLTAAGNPFTAMFVCASLIGTEPGRIGNDAAGMVLVVFLVAGVWFTAAALCVTSRPLWRVHARIRSSAAPLAAMLLICFGTIAIGRSVLGMAGWAMPH